MDLDSIGVVLSRRVPVANVAAFEQALHELMKVAARQPGQIAADVLRGPSRAGEREYFIVYRFTDEARLRAWEGSAARRSLVARIDPLALGGRRHELTGLEAWFDIPVSKPPPSLHRMALLTWLGIWPLVSLALWLLTPYLMALPLLVRTAVLSGMLVLAMTYLVMPRLTSLATPWLYRDVGGQSQVS
jgi:antibiotic biosynthesis monooxygenase (ABM) superfamily enzyme